MTENEQPADPAPVEAAPATYQHNADAFYHDPPVWVGDSLVDPTSQTLPNFTAFSQTMFQKSLASGIEIKVSADGLFAFGFADWEPGQYPARQSNGMPDFDKLTQVILNRTLVMNSFLALLYTNEKKHARFERDWMVVTPELLVTMNSLDHGGMGFGNDRVSHLLSARFAGTYVPHLPASFDNRLSFRMPLPVDVVERAADDLAKLMQSGKPDGLQLGDLFLKATKSYQDHNYSQAVILYWAIIEKLINELWAKYKADNKERDGRTFISGERAKRLDDGRSFTASVISEILSFANYIDYDLYADMSKVRKRRNDWMHSLGPISREDAVTAASVSSRLLLSVRGVELIGKAG